MIKLAFESKAASFQSWALSLGAFFSPTLSSALKTGPGIIHDPGSDGRLTAPEQSALPFFCSDRLFHL